MYVERFWSYLHARTLKRREVNVSIKRLFWNSGEEENPEPDSTEVTPLSPSLPRPVTRVPTLNPLAALRNGPSASIFERTTGLQSVEAVASSRTAPTADKEFDAVILTALDQDSKEPGFKEFTTQFLALSSIIPDRAQCTAAALAAVSAANPKLNATQVAKAIGERLQLLSGYATSYEGDSRRNEGTEKSEKNSSTQDAQSRIHELNSEIARLTSERVQLEAQVGRLQGELDGVTQKYDDYRGRFEATVSARREELKRLLNFVAPGAAGKGN
jgi:hypothetical protein